MALQTSGAISLDQIWIESQGSGFAGGSTSNMDVANIRNLLEASGKTINNTAGTAISFSDFYGAEAFGFGAATNTLASALFTQAGDNTSGGNMYAGIQIKVTWNSNNSHTIAYQDGTLFNPGGDFYTGGSSGSGSFTTSVNPETLQFRWVINSARIGHADTNSGNEFFRLNYNVNSTTTVNLQDISNPANTDYDYTSSWITCTPSNFGGSSINTQRFQLYVGANASPNEEFARATFTLNSGGYVRLEFRGQEGNVPSNGNVHAFHPVHTIQKNYVSSSNPTLSAVSWEEPENSCIMPDMFVYTQASGYEKVRDIVVGDRILAAGSLTDASVEDQYVEVTEVSPHNRSGYWDVKGLHITNDHPIWIGGAWVKVEDLDGRTSRAYVEEDSTPIYLGTTPGWYYVYGEDRISSDEAKLRQWIVSGEYAPTAE